MTKGERMPAPSLTLYVDGIIYAQHARSGVNTYFDHLLPRLPAHGVVVEVFVPAAPLAVPAGGPGVTLRRRDLLPRRLGISYRVDRLVGAVAERVNGRLLAARTSRPGVFVSTFLTHPRTRLPHLAVAYDLTHERLAHRFPGVWDADYRAAMRRHYRRADRVLAISEQTRRDAVELYGLNPDRVSVVHLGVDRAAYFPVPDRPAVPGLPADAPYLLYVGKRYPYKNWPGLLAGFARSKARTDCYLVAAGGPLGPDERAAVEKLGVGDRVRAAANPDLPALRALYSHAAGFVYPSLYEGFGLPLLEAMACGCPVLASDLPVFREVAGDAAAYFDPDDPDAVAAALPTVLGEDARRSLVASGVARCESFTWNRCAAETAAVIRHAAGCRP